jgi:hypothetical protein
LSPAVTRLEAYITPCRRIPIATQTHATVRNANEIAAAANTSEIPPSSISKLNRGCLLNPIAPFVMPKEIVHRAAKIPASESGRMYDRSRSLGRIANQTPANAGVSEIIIPRMAA